MTTKFALLAAATATIGGVSPMAPAPRAAPVASAQHVTIARDAGRYGGWPANHGIWIWGNEILVGFSWGHLKLGDPERHPIDRERPEEHMLARSLDGGNTWKLEKPVGLTPPPRPGHIAGVPTEPGGNEAANTDAEMTFAAPGFALTARMSDIHVGPSWFFWTPDRGHSWRGPFRLPDFGHKGIAARTDYLIDGPRELTMFLTAAKANGREGRVICVRTSDGGRTWRQVGLVGPEPDGNDYSIMPSSVRLSSNTILTMTRHRGWIDLFRSDDNGATWRPVNKAVPDTGRGNPPSLVKLADGRLLVTYGYRAAPFGIRARFSRDHGETWSEERVLRDDAADWDLGYTRSVQRPDGRIVTVYYYNDRSSPERYIAATIWTAP